MRLFHENGQRLNGCQYLAPRLGYLVVPAEHEQRLSGSISAITQAALRHSTSFLLSEVFSLYTRDAQAKE